MQVLIITLGSVGDLLPLLSIARALRSRGHEVSIAGSNTFEPLVRRSGFEFNTVLYSDRVQRPTEDARLWDLNRIWAMGWERVLAPAMRPTYELIREKSKERPCVVLAHWVVFGARLAAEKLGVPYGTIYMSPEVLNACDTTGMHGPRWRTFSEDEVFGPLLNAYRGELGLAPVDHIASQWLHSPQLGLALFPEWFCERRPCWPTQAMATGFITFDDPLGSGSFEHVDAFLDDGEAPVVFTPGTGMPQAADFFRESLATCASLGKRAILLTPHRGQVPADLPPWALHVDYIPLNRILGRAATLVHHGGIGTCAQAMRAATAQLVVPIKGDQFDNAQHIEALGLGTSVPMKEYKAAVVSRKLTGLCGDTSVRRACDELAIRFASENPLQKICAAVERLG
jgi:rhamnosyltransferase subunit B